jgi:hypothetical protein
MKNTLKTIFTAAAVTLFLLSILTTPATAKIFSFNNSVSDDLPAGTETAFNREFETQLANRYPELPKGQRERYTAELLANQNFKAITTTGDKVAKLKTTLMPILKLFKRENYTEIAVFESSRPFVATYNEFTIVFSTGELDILTDEQLRGVAAHELAHDIFMKDFEAAIKAKDFAAMQQIELKCDFVAAQISRTNGENPLAVVEAVKAMRRWLAENGIAAQPNDSHPEPAEREKALKAALKNLKN